ncbi:hypothetical protein ACF0H5_016863 [Mactra antiquata]
MEQKRKLLYPVAKAARDKEQNSVKLVRDKLFINGQQYIPSNENTQQSTHGRSQQRYNTYNNNRERQYNNYQTRTFKRNQGTHTNSDIPVSNRFSVLNHDSDISTPARSRGSKKRATSPLEYEQSTKKQHIENSENSTYRISTKNN